ncbi:MAG: hypothetical protein AAGC49_13695 [Brevundimonas sp.]
MATTSRRTGTWIAATAFACLFGAVGLAVLGEVLLLRARPRTPAEQTWRLAGLTTLTTVLVAGLVGGVVGLVIGMRTYAPTAWFAFIEGGLAGGFCGLLVGAAVATVLALDLRRQWRTA